MKRCWVENPMGQDIGLCIIHRRASFGTRRSLVGDFAPLLTGRRVVLGVFEVDYSNVSYNALCF